MFVQQCSIICSMAQIQTEESLSNLRMQPRNSTRRFQRSKSGERSRSNSRKESPSFCLQNVYIRPSNLNQHLQPPLQAQTKGEGESTLKTIKRRNNHMKQSKQASQNKLETQQILQRRCQELNRLLEKSHSYIIDLESKIQTLQNEVNKLKNPNQDISIKISKTQFKDKAHQSRGNNLLKLRKQIAQTRKIDIIRNEVSNEQLQMVQAENLFLKQQVNKLKLSIIKYQQATIKLRQQKETQHLRLIQRLRRNLKQHEQRQQQLRLQIGMLRLRQSKQTLNRKQQESEQLVYLRYRYKNLRKKYEQAKQHFEQYMNRANYLMSGKEDMEITLQLSP